MKSLYLPLLLTIGGNIVYHISQKSVPKTANPLVTMIIAYGVAIAVCAICSVFYPADRSVLNAIRGANWAVYAIGVGVAAVEVGFLLSYRAGWGISVAPVLSGVGVALLLILIGVLGFKEQLSLWNIIGVVLCLIGLVLVNHK
jgi:uncharacterized membrane protein